MEADYILKCQYNNEGNSSNGAINDIYAKPEKDKDLHGVPTYIKPGESAMAILGLIIASQELENETYMTKAQSAAHYLVSVQQSDGAWCDQYNYSSPANKSESPRHTAEVMIAFYKLNESNRSDLNNSRYDAMMKGAQYLRDCQNSSKSKKSDSRLLCGGKNEAGIFSNDCWTHDNAYAYWALRAAKAWADDRGDLKNSSEFNNSSQKILDGINQVLYDNSTGVWQIAIDEYGKPFNNAELSCVNGKDKIRPSWIQYSPQMLGLPVKGANSSNISAWIYKNFANNGTFINGPKTGCIGCSQYYCEGTSEGTRMYPGYAFQAAITWLGMKNHTDEVYAKSAISWAENSTLWQKSPDNNSVTGGWIDWVEIEPKFEKEKEWKRFIDTSFYAIACWNEGYDFRISS
jgi:hypothetical protein